MAFVIQKIYQACVFNCILINMLIFVNELPITQGNIVPITFPGGMRRSNSSQALLGPSSQQRSFVANVSKCAENKLTYCIKNDDYPIEYVRKLLLQEHDRYADTFISDIVTDDNVNARIDDVGIEYLCDSYEKIIFPTSGKTRDGDDVFIINTDDHRQGVRVSLCRSPGQTCMHSDAFPVGYRSECKQQMVYRQLLSLGADGQTVKNHFEFPACCSCVLHNLNFS